MRPITLTRVALVLIAVLLVAAPAARAQVLPPNPQGPKANWALFDKFGTANMRNLTFSTTITPRWIGETDSMFYSWRDHSGEHWWLVNALLRIKKQLIDNATLAAQLSGLQKKAVEAYALNDQFTLINITKDHKNLRFASDSVRYNWVLATETLTSMGRYRGTQDSLMVKDEEVDLTLGGGRGGGGGGGRGAGAAPGGRGGAPDIRNWSPDSTAFVYARNHNLFIVEKAKGDTTQITHEGIDKFSFAGGGRGGGGGQQDSTQQQQQDVVTTDSGTAANRPSRAAVTWSPDSRAVLHHADGQSRRQGSLSRALAHPAATDVDDLLVSNAGRGQHSQAGALDLHPR